jgi:two-component system, OmpR family, phosphate regulon response regulator PhoB
VYPRQAIERVKVYGEPIWLTPSCASKEKTAVMTKQIIIVDDDRDILDMMQLTLEYEGYQVKASTNSNCFRQLQPGNLPRLILLDVQLSGEDGMAICRQLKANTLTKDIPIILASAIDVGSQVRKEKCADDFLAKPFSLKTLIDKVHRYVPW